MTKILSLLFLICVLFSTNANAVVERWESLNYKTDSKLKNFIINSDLNGIKFNKYDVSSSFDKEQIVSNIVGLNSTMYFMDKKSNIIIFSLLEQKILKKIPLKDYKNKEVAGITYGDDYLYITFSSGYILAFSLITNTINWEIKLISPITSAPILGSSKIFVVAYNTLIAIDKNSGRQMWNVLGSRNGVSLKKLNIPTIYGGYVWVGLFSSDILVVNEDNGSLLWRNNLVGSNLIGITPNPLLGDIKASIVIDEEKAFVVSNNKASLYKVNNGEIVWSQNNINTHSTPVIINNYAYLVDVNGYFLQINMINGSIEYKIQLKSLKEVKEKVYWYAPLVINNSIILNSNFGDFAVINPKDGRVLSQNLIYKSKSEKLYNSAIILQDSLIYLSSKGNLYISK
jgi:outer membrane protein assembly factor BamB